MSRKIRKGGLLAAAAAAACVSVPAQAVMSCWNETQVAAAKVRDLQSRLMVATMRCRAMGIDVTPAYNRFVVANRGTLQGANRVILGQFEAGYGADGQLHYDRFATSLANAYGGEETDSWICAETEEIAGEAEAAEGDVERLVRLADRVGAPPALPGGRCEISFALPEAPEAAGDAGLEPIDPATVPADRWDAVEAIPPPADALEQAEADSAPAPASPEFEAFPAPVRPRGKVEGKADLRSHI